MSAASPSQCRLEPLPASTTDERWLGRHVGEHQGQSLWRREARGERFHDGADQSDHRCEGQDRRHPAALQSRDDDAAATAGMSLVVQFVGGLGARFSPRSTPGRAASPWRSRSRNRTCNPLVPEDCECVLECADLPLRKSGQRLDALFDRLCLPGDLGFVAAYNPDKSPSPLPTPM